MSVPTCFYSPPADANDGDDEADLDQMVNQLEMLSDNEPLSFLRVLAIPSLTNMKTRGLWDVEVLLINVCLVCLLFSFYDDYSVN